MTKEPIDDRPAPCPVCASPLTYIGDPLTRADQDTEHFVCTQCMTHWRYDGWGDPLVRVSGPEDCE